MVLFKISPYLAGLLFFASLQANPATDNAVWEFIWRTGMTIVLTLITALAGIVYRDQRAWIKRVEEINSNNHKQNSEAILAIAKKFERMIGVVSMIPLLGANATVEEKLRMIQEVRTVLER